MSRPRCSIHAELHGGPPPMRPHWIIPAVSALNLAGPGGGYRRGRDGRTS
jgi:hypothetical protein